MEPEQQAKGVKQAMKINEVEELTGITKKNIRFYEEQGLLSPCRNAENGYRVYGEQEVKSLKQIKLMRKLGVPIEDIRRMFTGMHTVADGMRRHLVTLERERQNLEHSAALCRELQEMDIPLSEVDADSILEQMDMLERSGTSFKNKQTEDVRIRYVAPVIVAIIMVGLMLGMVLLIAWTYALSPEDAPPVAVLAVMALLCIVVAAGVLLAMVQRIREIGKGEMDDARKY